MNDAAVPWKRGLQARGHVQIFLDFVDGGDGGSERCVRREVERDGDGGELALMGDHSGSVLFSKCAKALSGTDLLITELEVPAEVAPLLEVAAEVLRVKTFPGGASVFAEAV